jgi:hypothetical protein
MILKDQKHITTVKWNNFYSHDTALDTCCCEEQNDPPEALITTKYMKIAELVWLSLYMRDNEKVQHPSRPLAPAWAVLNSQHLIVLASIVSKDE